MVKGVGALISASKAKGDNYEKVVAAFEEAGFSNITVNGLPEKPVFLQKIGNVKTITINGDPSSKRTPPSIRRLRW